MVKVYASMIQGKNYRELGRLIGAWDLVHKAEEYIINENLPLLLTHEDGRVEQYVPEKGIFVVVVPGDEMTRFLNIP